MSSNVRSSDAVEAAGSTADDDMAIDEAELDATERPDAISAVSKLKQKTVAITVQRARLENACIMSLLLFVIRTVLLESLPQNARSREAK